jgi:hypothetical protein
MQLQSSSQDFRNGATQPASPRSDKEYGILSLKWTVKSLLKDFGYQCELLFYALAREREKSSNLP